MKQKNDSLVSNYLFNLIKTISNLAFPLITFTYSSRILGVEGVGRISFAKSIISYFSMFAMLGINYYGTREVAKLRLDKIKLSKFVHEMLIINGTALLIAYFLLFSCIRCISKLHDYQSLLLVNSIAILLQFIGMEWLYQGLEEYRYITLRSLIFQLISVVLMVFTVRGPDDVLVYSLISILASSGSYILNLFKLRRIIIFRRFNHYEIKKHLGPLLWLFALVVSMELYLVLDTTMLGFMKGDGSVGRYTVAEKFNKMVIKVITSLGTVLIPRLSFYIEHGKREKVRSLVEKSYNFIFLLSVPSAIGLFLLSDDIIHMFNGPEFGSSAVTMRILSPLVLIIPFSMTSNQQTLIPMGHEKKMLVATSLGAVTNLICNSFLIPSLEENGAAIATVVAESVVAFVSWKNVSKFFNMRCIFKNYYQYWVASAPIPLLVFFVKLLPVHRVLQTGLAILSSLISYFLLLWKMNNPYFDDALSIIKNKIRK